MVPVNELTKLTANTTSNKQYRNVNMMKIDINNEHLKILKMKRYL